MSVSESLQSLLDFLKSLLGDEEAREEFARDPQGMLERNGFGDLCAEDVQEVRPLLMDDQSVGVRESSGTASGSNGGNGGGGSNGGDGSAADEINHITNHYTIKENTVSETTWTNLDYTYVDNRDYVYTDDRDVIGDNNTVNNGSINASGGSAVTVGDGSASGSQDNSEELDIRYSDSFNQDNDGADVDGDHNATAVGQGNTAVGGNLDASEDHSINDSFQDNDGTDVDATKSNVETGQGSLDQSEGKGDDTSIEDSFNNNDLSSGKGDDIHNSNVGNDQSRDDNSDDESYRNVGNEDNDDFEDSFNEVDQEQDGLINVGNLNDTLDVGDVLSDNNVEVL